MATSDPTTPEGITARLQEILADPDAIKLLAMNMDEAKDALEGDSNDDEHDALVGLAEHLGLRWTPSEF